MTQNPNNNNKKYYGHKLILGFKIVAYKTRDCSNSSA